jgi:hypothetical protein
VGHLATPSELVTFCKNFQPNVIFGDTSQIIHFATYVESTSVRDSLCIDKILYTSESMMRLQRSYLDSVFSQSKEKPLGFHLLLVSAEMGIWTVGNFGLTGSQEEDTADFIFDSRHMIVEVLPLDSQPTKGSTKHP